MKLQIQMGSNESWDWAQLGLIMIHSTTLYNMDISFHFKVINSKIVQTKIWA